MWDALILPALSHCRRQRAGKPARLPDAGRLVRGPRVPLQGSAQAARQAVHHEPGAPHTRTRTQVQAIHSRDKQILYILTIYAVRSSYAISVSRWQAGSVEPVTSCISCQSARNQPTGHILVTAKRSPLRLFPCDMCKDTHTTCGQQWAQVGAAYLHATHTSNLTRMPLMPDVAAADWYH